MFGVSRFPHGGFLATVRAPVRAVTSQPGRGLSRLRKFMAAQ